MQRPKSPPLNSIRAFEAAARHGSFVLAANELCVTAGAIAQQVKILEHWADTKLFDRNANGVSLTPAGESVKNEFVTAFDELGNAVQKLRSIATPSEVQIATLPSIAQFWLSPLLPKIRESFPDVTVSVSALDTPPNMQREPIDICIYYEQAPDKSSSDILVQDIIFPVCSADFLKNLQHSSQNQTPTLLHDSQWLDDWKIWLTHNPRSGYNHSTGPIYSLYSLAVEQAKNGVGLLIGHELLVRQFLDNGVLVKPYKSKKVKLDRWLTLKTSNSSSSNPIVSQLSNFLKRQA